MTFFPNLLAALAILLPPGSGENVDLGIMGPGSVHTADASDDLKDLIYCPAQVPSESESFFEYVDESALDEEDSTRVEDHGIVPLTLFDYQLPCRSHLFMAFLPVDSCSHLLPTTPVLRC